MSVSMILPKGYVCVGFYEVSRAFGGHEEGGWSYDHFDHLESVVIPEGEVESLRKAHDGEIVHSFPMGSQFVMGGYSAREGLGEVFGDTKKRIVVESYPGSQQTTERPRYK